MSIKHFNLQSVKVELIWGPLCNFRTTLWRSRGSTRQERRAVWTQVDQIMVP